MHSMLSIEIVGLILIVATAIFSYYGLTRVMFLERFEFNVGSILYERDYKRLITTGFLHVSWSHLFFNMLSLYLFSYLVELQLGAFGFFLLYFGSLIGGDVLTLYIRRNYPDYRSVGASGAICGVIFASIALFPGIGIGSMFLPFEFPGWLYGIFYIVFSIYGITTDTGNVGHAAHLGGALTGVVIAVGLHPSILTHNYLTIGLITVPTIMFISLIIVKPEVMLFSGVYFFKRKKNYTVEHKYNENIVNKQNELDALLDKISQKGIESLSKKEKQKLDEYSK